MPDVLGGFTVGGSIDAPIVAQAFAEGLVIVGIVAVFAAFNAVISHHELLQSLPRAFYEVGLIVAVGVAFVPSTIAAVHDVREADRARTGGRVVRRGRIVRQLVPVLETGLERAITLSESMDSRGFAHGGAAPREHVAGWCGAGALLALAGAFVALVARESGVALGLGLVGTGALVAAVVLASRGSRRVRYRPRPLTRGDWTVMAAAWLAPAALAAASIAGDGTLRWSASPLQWPGLHAIPLLALAALASPLLVSSAAGTVPSPRAAPAVPMAVEP
jgi:energy-coupling factor transport system permease protein